MKQIKWTRTAMETFIHESMLTDFEEKVIRTRIEQSWTRTKQAYELHCSLSTIDRTIKDLRERYDVIQKHHPDIMPVRRMSAQEEYLDNN